MHLGTGLVCGSKIKDMVKAGFEFIIFLADWHSWINNKLGGDLEKIRFCGEYFKHCFTSLGVPREDVSYVWASDIVKDVDYWRTVIQIGKQASIQRVRRTLPIMGRGIESESLDVEAAALFYPCMQAADIFHMKVDVACAGIDQRKAHMLARDSAEKLGWRKPACVHTHLLIGLTGPSDRIEGKFDENPDVDGEIGSKMSKSIPRSCIFIHDAPKDIESKILSAYCSPKQVEANPILELAKYTVLPELGHLNIDRAEKHGGPISYPSYLKLEEAYRRGEIHPLDLKKGVAEALTGVLSSVREYFSKHSDVLDEMMKIDVTR